MLLFGAVSKGSPGGIISGAHSPPSGDSTSLFSAPRGKHITSCLRCTWWLSEMKKKTSQDFSLKRILWPFVSLLCERTVFFSLCKLFLSLNHSLEDFMFLLTCCCHLTASHQKQSLSSADPEDRCVPLFFLVSPVSPPSFHLSLTQPSVFPIFLISR